ncbi:MAG: restriction endonuclease subunit S [Bacteroidetes bacterium]|nr:restriction endonuclease subunit S [Bacteroidota bacterium]
MNKVQTKITSVGKIPQDWEIKKIKEFAKTTAGGTPSTRVSSYWDNGTVRWMSSGDLNQKKIFEVEGRITEEGLKNSSARMIPPKSILIGLAGQGKTRGTVAINMVELSTNQSVAAILPNEKFVPEFLYYNLDMRYDELRKLSTGDGGRGGLNLQIINSIPIPFPNLLEQKSIVKYLQTWDNAIEQTENLIAAKEKLKKGLMQQLLTSGKRLKGFKGKWKKTKFSDVFERVTRKNTEKNQNVVTVSAQRGFVKQNDFFNKFVASEELKDYFLLERGEFVYNKSYSKGYDWGAVKLLKEFDKAVVTTLYICFKMKKEFMNSTDFFEHFFAANIINEGLTKIAHEGGRAHGLLNVTPKDFFSLKIFIPDVEEQKAISNILNSIDKEICFLKEYLNKLTEQKKGLMQVLLTGKVRVKI